MFSNLLSQLSRIARFRDADADAPAYRLGPWPVVTAAVTDANVLAVGHMDLNFVELAIGGHVRRLVGHQVLLAQFPFELREGLIEVFHIFGDEGAPAGRLTKFLQRLPVNPVSRRVADPYGV